MTVNVMGNNIGKEQLSKLQEMMKAHPTLVSLCGIADDTTDANLSGIKMDADDAVILADELPAKGALETLNISNNKLNNGQRGLQEICPAIAASKITSLDISSNYASMNGGTYRCGCGDAEK